MKNSLLLISSLFCSALAFGCGDKDEDTGANTTKNPVTSESVSSTVDPSDGTTGSNPTTGSDPTTPVTATGTGTDGGTTADPGTSDTAAFIVEIDMIIAGECDVFIQDCKEGEKCEAVITDGGGAWNSSKCVPVTGEGVAGDPCTAESVADGLDSCAKGNMCWGVDMDGNGTCVELCKGTPDAPVCPDNGFCTIANMGFLNLCLPGCDPLLQDCAEGDACYSIDDGFTCAPDASGDVGKTNDPCEFINVCEAGLLCGDPAFVGAGCPQGSMGCCTPFCEFPDGACPNPDQKCVQYFVEPFPMEPKNSEDIGVCGIPM